MPKSRKTYDSETFTNDVLVVVKNIPAGEACSYAEVATRAGYPGYARQVARIMSHNYKPDVPCHRVIHSDGTLGKYNRGGEVAKRALLRKEGFLR